MNRPFIQIDDVGNTREMTEEEYDFYLATTKDAQNFSFEMNETPSAIDDEQ